MGGETERASRPAAPDGRSRRPPAVSVLIATRDRADMLRGTLASLCTPANVDLPDWEIVVADNGSSDATVKVCQEFAERFPGRVRWLVEGRQGKSNALNAGLRLVEGDVVAMTDDDVICAPDFLAETKRVFSDPSIVAAQGRVYLDWLGGEPTWLDEMAKQLMSLRDYGDEMFDWTDNLSGCNMIVRRHAALAVGGFAAELGPGTIGIAEDSEFSIRLRERGYRTVYAPSIVVRHQVPAGRVTPDFLRARYFGIGRSYAYYNSLSRPIWRFGLFVLKDVLTGEVEAFRLRNAGKRADAVRRQCEARQRVGFFWQHLLFRLGIKERSLTYMDSGIGSGMERVRG